MEKEKIKLGEIVKAVGIKGEVKVLSYSDDPNRYTRLKRILIGNWETKVEKARIKDRQPIIKIEGVDNRNRAEELIGSPIFMWSEDLEKLPKGQFYIKDLIGCIVYDEELGKLGEVKEILTDRPQHLYKVESQTYGEIYFPWVKEFLKEVDIEKKEIRVCLPEGIVEI